jgi:hypothetical protein
LCQARLLRGSSRAFLSADHYNVKHIATVKTHVIWRLKERRDLRRCYQLRNADIPRAEMTPTGYHSIAAKFAEFATALDQFQRGLENPEYGAAPLIWREQSIAICYRLLFPNPIVEVLWVRLDQPEGMVLNQSTDPTLALGTSPAGQEPRPR